MCTDRPVLAYVSCAGGTSGIDYSRKPLYLQTVEQMTARLTIMGWRLMCVCADGTAQFLRSSDNRILILEPFDAVS